MISENPGLLTRPSWFSSPLWWKLVPVMPFTLHHLNGWWQILFTYSAHPFSHRFSAIYTIYPSICLGNVAFLLYPGIYVSLYLWIFSRGQPFGVCIMIIFIMRALSASKLFGFAILSRLFPLIHTVHSEYLLLVSRFWDCHLNHHQPGEVGMLGSLVVDTWLMEKCQCKMNFLWPSPALMAVFPLKACIPFCHRVAALDFRIVHHKWEKSWQLFLLFVCVT